MLRLTLSLALLLAACGQPPSTVEPQAPGGVPQSHGGVVRDHVSLVDALRASGYLVEPVSDVRRAFLRPAGTLLRISAGDLDAPLEIESYNYDERDLGGNGIAAARADAAQIQADGQPKSGPVTWSGPPHFFLKERVLVLYVGADARLLSRLGSLLGPQFAGSSA